MHINYPQIPDNHQVLRIFLFNTPRSFVEIQCRGFGNLFLPAKSHFQDFGNAFLLKEINFQDLGKPFCHAGHKKVTYFSRLQISWCAIKYLPLPTK
jgi:hypothetical protein